MATTPTTGNDTLTGTSTADNLDGLAGNDSISGLGSGDTLNGGPGDDTLEGGASGDIMFGGTGNDWLSYSGSSAGVTIDLSDRSAAIPVTRAVEDMEETPPATSSKSSRTSRIQRGRQSHGDSSANHLKGLGGDDTIDGSGGDDTIEGGAGRDSLTGGTGHRPPLLRGVECRGVGEPGHGRGLRVAMHKGDTLNDADAASGFQTDFEEVLGSTLGDNLTGDSNANHMKGLGGDGHHRRRRRERHARRAVRVEDSLTGGTGTDRLSYEGSNAGVSVNLATGVVSGGHAQGGHPERRRRRERLPDRLRGGLGLDSRRLPHRRLPRATGSAAVTGATCSWGGGGDDTIHGGDGNDTVEGGAGRDSLRGGAGYRPSLV